MDGIYDILIGVFGDSSAMMLALLVFLATAVLAFGVMVAARARSAVKRRAAGIAEYIGRAPSDQRVAAQLEPQGRAAPARLHHQALSARPTKTGDDEGAAAPADPGRHLRCARGRATSSSRAPRWRSASAFGAFVLLPMVVTRSRSMFWLSVMAGGIVGYVGPSMYIDRRIAARRDEHRSGFPDFMDLLVVCADSGLSMEAALERVGRELGDSYPSLCANIHMTNLEIRAGRTMTEALEHFGDRLGLEEARSFATLIQQSAELGSSITDALRVYSDDMRHKRLSRAEEKAYSLPAKLSVPMMVCIFPVLFVVILLPVVVRLYTGHY